MESKYCMSLEDNIDYAKRKLIDTIYSSAREEGIAITIADTVDFLNKVNTGRISIDDMFKLEGLKDGWELVLNSINEDLTIDYLKKLHFEICKGQGIHPLGDFRDRGVGISGTNWRPESPENCNYEEELNNIMSMENPLERCLELFCWIQRSQMFIDGNKRVANLVTNKELIKNGQGILLIPVEKMGEYFKYLINYYETNDSKEIKEWLYNNCLDGLELNKGGR